MTLVNLIIDGIILNVNVNINVNVNVNYTVLVKDQIIQHKISDIKLYKFIIHLNYLYYKEYLFFNSLKIIA
jgi:hypothetical protein